MEEERTHEKRLGKCREELEARGQTHVLRWWGELSVPHREELLTSIESVPWDLVDTLVRTHVYSSPSPRAGGGLSPALVYPQRPQPDQESLYDDARRVGDELLRAGKVAAFTVAGGQGSRLGVSGPKGAVVVTPVGGRSLFQFFAETLLAAQYRYGVALPWYVMTSSANHHETVRFFEDHAHWGLRREDVVFFPQGMLPAFDFSGRLLMEERHRVALAPDGHGGSLKAMAKSGALEGMRRNDVEIISYFQVDNPLVQPFDPLFLGLHRLTGSEMSTKVARKADDLERVGNVCMQDGKVAVIEYTEFPETAARARDPDGRRTFDAGNLAIHLLDTAFVARMTERPQGLPYRRAEKAVPFMDEKGVRVEPRKPNAVKLETFIFDVLPSARTPLVLEVDRAEEFSPVKNATGVDSLETAQRDLVRRSCRWLELAGIHVPRRGDGEPDVTVVLSPLRALDAAEVGAKRDSFPRLQPGDIAYLE